MLLKNFLVSLVIFYSLPIFAAEITSKERPKSWNNIEHIVVIVLENTTADEALKQPFMGGLTEKGAYLDQFYAVAHPSQPNYLALAGGSTFEVGNDDEVNIRAANLGDLISSWKVYAEDYPGNCYLGMFKNDYARKHNPLISFVDIQTNPKQCNKIVSATEFHQDMKKHQLPAISFYIPNQKNDGHDTGAAYADTWLKKAFAKWFADPEVLKNTLFVITFDEDDYRANNRIYTLLLGAGVKAGVRSNTRYNHYSLLKTVEEIYKLKTLGKNDKAANAITDIW
jgi:phospholipase C